jgi:hypothetical protein
MRGKFAYLPPERLLRQPIDRRTDQFSLGIVLYELIAGVHPFAAESLATTQRAMLETAPAPLAAHRAHLPQALDGVVQRLLAKKKEERYATLAEACTAIAALDLSPRPSHAAVAQFLSEQELGTASAEDARAVGPEHMRDITAESLPPPRVGQVRNTLATVGLSLAAVGVVLYFFAPAHPAPAPVALPAPPSPMLTIIAPPSEARPADPAPMPSRPHAPAHPPAAREVPTHAGVLQLRVEPWARVKIDGKDFGVTPIQPVQLPAGEHVVIIENSELARSLSRKIVIRDDATTRLAIDFTRDLQ